MKVIIYDNDAITEQEKEKIAELIQFNDKYVFLKVDCREYLIPNEIFEIFPQKEQRDN